MNRNRQIHVGCNIACLLFAAFFVFGCVGDPPETLEKGTLMDAGTVKGLEYKSGYRRGITDKDGAFYYVSGDDVAFYIGNTLIGKIAPAQGLMSSLNLIEEGEPYATNTNAQNISRFLQSLDADNDVENGIEITEEIAAEVDGMTIDFAVSVEEFDADPEIRNLFARLNRTLSTADEAKRLLLDKFPATFINLGDGWTAGAQSGLQNLNEHTQELGYAALVSSRLGEKFELAWSNPLLVLNDDRTTYRKNGDTPYNIGVPGATVKSLLEETTGSSYYLLTRIMYPVQDDVGHEVTQIETAEYLANTLNAGKLQFFTLDIGKNDVLGAVTAEDGTLLDYDNVEAFLYDSENGHDLESVSQNLETIVERLDAIPSSYIFIANIPYVTGIGAIFSESDIERLAAFEGADVTVLSEGDHIGISAFLDLETAMGPDSDNTALNDRISEIIEESGNVLNAESVALLNTRVDEINAKIAEIADRYGHTQVIDYNAFFQKVENGEVTVGSGDTYDTLHRRHGGGTFSLDGFNPSNTCHALIADKYIEAIEQAESDIDLADIDEAETWASDTYRDNDGDGWVPGPEDTDVISAAYEPLADCDDGDANILPPNISGADCESD